jgi:hypothetical protein
MTYKLLLPSVLVILLSACGSDDNKTEIQTDLTFTPTAKILTGVFLDSAVAGLNYKTASQNGQTNELGEFSFQEGEVITFSIGDIEFPTTAAALYLTPLELYQTNDINQIEVVNLLRLLQTLDSDGDASNGINIAESIHQLAVNIDLDFSSTNFDQQSIELVSQSGAVNQELITVEAALNHFQLTLIQIENDSLTSCTMTHEKVGHSGFFTSFAHNVSGKATIIDDCTIAITQFSYDGRGPAVYFYGAVDHQYDNEAAFPIDQKISGQSYDNVSMIIKLPQNKSLDDLTGLSVWCIDFAANFGQMEFTP